MQTYSINEKIKVTSRVSKLRQGLISQAIFLYKLSENTYPLNKFDAIREIDKK